MDLIPCLRISGSNHARPRYQLTNQNRAPGALPGREEPAGEFPLDHVRELRVDRGEVAARRVAGFGVPHGLVTGLAGGADESRGVAVREWAAGDERFHALLTDRCGNRRLARIDPTKVGVIGSSNGGGV